EVVERRLELDAVLLGQRADPEIDTATDAERLGAVKRIRGLRHEADLGVGGSRRRNREDAREGSTANGRTKKLDLHDTTSRKLGYVLHGSCGPAGSPARLPSCLRQGYC